jgi:hypothetical protein
MGYNAAERVAVKLNLSWNPPWQALRARSKFMLSSRTAIEQICDGGPQALGGGD